MDADGATDINCLDELEKALNSVTPDSVRNHTCAYMYSRFHTGHLELPRIDFVIYICHFPKIQDIALCYFLGTLAYSAYSVIDCA